MAAVRHSRTNQKDQLQAHSRLLLPILHLLLNLKQMQSSKLGGTTVNSRPNGSAKSGTQIHDRRLSVLDGADTEAQRSRTPDFDLRSFLTGKSKHIRSSVTIPFTTRDALDLGTVSFPMKSLFGEVLDGSVHGVEVRSGMSSSTGGSYHRIRGK